MKSTTKNNLNSSRPHHTKVNSVNYNPVLKPFVFNKKATPRKDAKNTNHENKHKSLVKPKGSLILAPIDVTPKNVSIEYPTKSNQTSFLLNEVSSANHRRIQSNAILSTMKPITTSYNKLLTNFNTAKYCPNSTTENKKLIINKQSATKIILSKPILTNSNKKGNIIIQPNKQISFFNSKKNSIGSQITLKPKGERNHKKMISTTFFPPPENISLKPILDTPTKKIQPKIAEISQKKSSDLTNGEKIVIKIPAEKWLKLQKKFTTNSEISEKIKDLPINSIDQIINHIKSRIFLV